MDFNCKGGQSKVSSNQLVEWSMQKPPISPSETIFVTPPRQYILLPIVTMVQYGSIWFNGDVLDNLELFNNPNCSVQCKKHEDDLSNK